MATEQKRDILRETTNEHICIYFAYDQIGLCGDIDCFFIW